MRYLILSLLLLQMAKAETIKVGRGHISLIDLGSEILAEPSIAQEDFINIYSLSAQVDKDQKTVLAIQGLVDHGQTDFFIKTKQGVKHFDVELDKNSSELKRLGQKNRTIELKKNYKVASNSALRVLSPYYINDLVLAGDPSLMNLDSFASYYDKDYLKTFILKFKEGKAKTEIIVPTTNKVYKFDIEINPGGESNDNFVNLI